ncbi:hypothetical protein [Roseovarius sp. 2305UL8-3]|uniref:hypothetical protein n=1 Tax=Roseovarius conchicola TaxID=3121636 RepID=UPI0035297361
MEPGNRDDWIAQLGDALLSTSEEAHQVTLSSLVAAGVTAEQLYHDYIPEASRYLGKKWVSDEASFVGVTTGAARLQALFHDRAHATNTQPLLGRGAPPSGSVLMVIPDYEQHSLGAFVVADGLRRHGLGVRMAVGLSEAELTNILSERQFSMIGISLATWKSVESTAKMVAHLRATVDKLPPIVIGGRIVGDRTSITRCTGADYAVKSIKEAIKRCGLATAAEVSPLAGVEHCI